MTLYTSPQQINPTASLDDLQAPFLDSIEASGEDAYFHNPANALGRMAELGVAELNSVTRTIPAEELNERFGNLGLTFKRPEKESVVSVIVRRKLDEIERRSRLSRASGDVGTVAAQFLTGLAVSVADPINAASSFVPVVGASRYAMWVERFGKTGARFSRGAIEGAVGAAAVEPLVLAAAAMDQSEYGLMDSLLNVTFGTAIGGGLHVGFGALSDRLSGLRPSVREGALRSAVAQTAEGRPVNVDPVLRTDPGIFDPSSPHYAELAPLVNSNARNAIELDNLRRGLEVQRADAARLKAERISDALPEIVARHLDETTGLLLRDIQTQLEAPGLPSAKRADLERQRGQIIESVQGDLDLAIGRAEAEAKALKISHERARDRLDDAMRDAGLPVLPRDEGARLTTEQRAERRALARIQEKEARLSESQKKLSAAIERALTERTEMPSASPEGMRRVETEGRAAIADAAERERAFDEGRDPPEPDEAAAVREAREAASDAGKTQEGRIDADALDEEVADLTAEIDAMVRQGALTEEEAAGIARGVEPETVKAYQDGALAAARCMLLHP